MKRAAGSIAAAAVLLLVAIGLGWRTTAAPRVASPLDSWKGPSPDPLENKLRKLQFADGSSARLRVPARWTQRRAEALVVLLPRAGESAAGAAGRHPGLLEGPWLVLVPELPADAAQVQAGIDRVRAEYRTDPRRVLVVGEGEAAELAASMGCGGVSAVVVQRAPPCGGGGTAWAWTGSESTWMPRDEPRDPATWLVDEVRAWSRP